MVQIHHKLATEHHMGNSQHGQIVCQSHRHKLKQLTCKHALGKKMCKTCRYAKAGKNSMNTQEPKRPSKKQVLLANLQAPTAVLQQPSGRQVLRKAAGNEGLTVCRRRPWRRCSERRSARPRCRRRRARPRFPRAPHSGYPP